MEGFPPQPHALGYPRGVVFEEDVAGLRQLVEDLQALGFLDVHREAPLVAVEPHVTRRQALHGRVPVADQVAHAGTLDLDDLGPHLAQEAGAERAREDLFEGHDPHAA